MRYQVEIQLALQNHLFEQFVFADIGSNVFANLTGGQQQTVAQPVHPGVIADGREVLYPFADQGTNQILRDSAQPESADHDGRAIEDIFDGFVGAGNDFVHRQEILKQNYHGGTETQRKFKV